MRWGGGRRRPLPQLSHNEIRDRGLTVNEGPADRSVVVVVVVDEVAPLRYWVPAHKLCW